MSDHSDEEDFEDSRMNTIAANQQVLKDLGLDAPLEFPSKKTKKPVKKRKQTSIEHNDDEADPPPLKKLHTMDGGANDTNTLRRSQRNRGNKVDYTGDSVKRAPQLASVQAGLMKSEREPRSVNKRVHDPKVFGAIPGVPVGSWWQTREECSLDSIHAPWVAGISGGPDGAYSIALSGGYEDDVDYGDAFTFTGSGGRDLKGTKNAPKNLRTAPQSCDQSFENSYNKALQKSCTTKKPVRVIRGYKLDSPFAPAEGYRYDGLYTVEKAWMAPGLNAKGWKVCKFAFKRVPGQAPLITQTEESDEPDSLEAEGAASDAGGSATASNA